MQPSVVIEDITDGADLLASNSAFATPPASTHSDDDFASVASEESCELPHTCTGPVKERDVLEHSRQQGDSSGLPQSAAARPLTTAAPVEPSASISEQSEDTHLSEEDFAERLKKADEHKQAGNKLYIDGNLQEALAEYSLALECAPQSATSQRAVYFCNKAAVQLRLEAWADAAKAASHALELDGSYIKAYMRRAKAYQELDDLEHALADYQKVKDIGGSPDAEREIRRLTPIVEERREKMKEEMLGKLKELGNTVLGKFGMSLDNFKTVKDPNTGSYSISMQ